MNATEAQAEYLSTLFVDCGFTQVERKAFLARRTGRAIVDLKERKRSSPATADEEL